MYLCVVKRAAANFANVIMPVTIVILKTAVITSITRFEKYHNIV